jgi:hypothetical protein
MRDGLNVRVGFFCQLIKRHLIWILVRGMRL